MNAFLWSAAKPIAFTAGLAALTLLASRPRARRALWSLRLALARNTPAWGGRPVRDCWEDVQSGMAQAVAEAPAREMGVHIDDEDEFALAELAESTWPDGEYSEIIRYESRLWRRAARRLRRRAVTP